MPNTIPPVTHPEQVEEKKVLAEEKSLVDFALLGVVVQTNADQILPMARVGAVGFKIFFGETIGNLPFPDDGVCQDVFQNITESRLPLCIHAENRQIMYHHLNRIKEEGKTDPVNWESTRPAICEAESVHHALFFAETFGTKMHVLHMSSKQAAGMVRDAKARGLRITAETGPHYLLREPKDMDKAGPLLKMNPPVRTRDHGEALWDGLLNGYVDMIATDHSPHTLEEKGADVHGNMLKPAIWDCISGFCGVETGPSLILTEVNKGRMSLNHYVRLASENPAKVWQIYPQKGALQGRLRRRRDHRRHGQGRRHRRQQAAQQEQPLAVARLEDQGRAGDGHRARPRSNAGRRARGRGRRTHGVPGAGMMTQENHETH